MKGPTVWKFRATYLHNSRFEMIRATNVMPATPIPNAITRIRFGVVVQAPIANVLNHLYLIPQESSLQHPRRYILYEHT